MELFGHDANECVGEGFTFLYEFFHTYLLYVLLVLEAKLLFDFNLYGQTMGVETRRIPYVVASHPMVANEHVLHDFIPASSRVNFAGNIRRTVEEVNAVAALNFFLLFGINAVLLPKSKYLFFQFFMFVHSATSIRAKMLLL